MGNYLCFHVVIFDRVVFTFDPEDMKSMSNEVLDKSTGSHHHRPLSSTERIIQQHLAGRVWHYSAPSEDKKQRFSLGSLDYLSDGPGRLGGGVGSEGV